MNYRRNFIVVGTLLVFTAGFLFVVGGRMDAKRQAAEAKARKFDDYCRFVRTDFEGLVADLRDHDDLRFVQLRARRFYATSDERAVARCASPAVKDAAVTAIRARCQPPGSCVLADPEEPRCQVEPACLVKMIPELLALLPPLR